MKKSVFLGGTVNGSRWRDRVKKDLHISYFDPVVDDWNEEAQKAELKARKNSDFVLYYITPKMTGVYAIAELVDDSNKRPERTVFYFDTEDEGDVFTEHQVKAMKAVGKMISNNGAYWAQSYDDLINYLNAAKYLAPIDDFR